MRCRPRPAESGAAAVEFALVAPLLMLLVCGIISYGFMLSFRQSVSQAAAEAARAAAVAPATADRSAVAYAAVKDVMGKTCNAAGSYLHCSMAVTSGVIAVTVTYDYGADPHQLELLGTGIAMPDTLQYTASAKGNS
ncbi:TadE family protein [Nocardioides sp. LS1]|uniref:TadE family protein n=1 Tax=Nocardioides sp. LS1 TaxID=1027620 RepID=UPI00163B06AB|nr:TadE family protein [Nocardioides sp. LS1]